MYGRGSERDWDCRVKSEGQERENDFARDELCTEELLFRLFRLKRRQDRQLTTRGATLEKLTKQEYRMTEDLRSSEFSSHGQSLDGEWIWYMICYNMTQASSTRIPQILSCPMNFSNSFFEFLNHQRTNLVPYRTQRRCVQRGGECVF